jgi:hypothetical protein
MPSVAWIRTTMRREREYTRLNDLHKVCDRESASDNRGRERHVLWKLGDEVVGVTV